MVQDQGPGHQWDHGPKGEGAGLSDHAYVHEPVLLEETTTLLGGCGRILDGTAGGGGHAAQLAERGAVVLALDKDPAAVRAALERLAQFGERARVRELDFGEAAHDPEVVAFHPDGVLLDLGVSSHQLDDDRRGFSFRPGSRLDMRMAGRREGGKTGSETTAATWLNTAAVEEMADAFFHYADERRSRKLAREIARRRLNAPFAVSDELVGAIRAVLGPRSGPSDFARLFQAVRIAVNDELGRLERALPELLELLEPGGVMAVISYHSGEDRLVKNAFRDWAKRCVCPPAQLVCTCRGRALGAVLTKHPTAAPESETARNPRARSAHLRAFRKAS